MQMNRYFIFPIFVILILISPCFAAPPKNVIFFIGDGMGPEQVKAAGIYANGTPGTLCFESFPYQAEVTTYSADSSITDSAAAATALRFPRCADGAGAVEILDAARVERGSEPAGGWLRPASGCCRDGAAKAGGAGSRSAARFVYFDGWRAGIEAAQRNVQHC